MIILMFIFWLFIFPRSATVHNKAIKTQIIWRSSFIILPSLILQQVSFTSALPPLEIAAKLKEKIAKGKLLIEDLNDLLEQVKKNVKEKGSVEKDVLNTLVDLKDKFKKLELDPGDLPIDLIEKFKERTLEAFTLILTSYKLDRIPEASPQKILKKVEKEISKISKQKQLSGEL